MITPKYELSLLHMIQASKKASRFIIRQPGIVLAIMHSALPREVMTNHLNHPRGYRGFLRRIYARRKAIFYFGKLFECGIYFSL
jgi:hypothetical protein